MPRSPLPLLAVGIAPRAIVAIGLVPRGVVSIGLASFGSLAAVGLVSFAPLTDAVFFTLGAATFLHRDGSDVFLVPRFFMPYFPGEPVAYTLVALALLLALRRFAGRQQPRSEPDDIVLTGATIEGDGLRLTGKETNLHARAPDELRAFAEKHGGERLIARLRTDSVLDDHGNLDFRHAPEARVTHTVLALHLPPSADRVRRLTFHAIVAALAFTFTLSATLSYALAR